VSSAPDRFCIDKDDRQLYDALKVDPFFHGQRNRNLFLLAMAVGYKNELREPLTKREISGYFLEKDMKPEDHALVDMVAVCEMKSVDVLAKRSEAFKIAEEYAHGGIRLLSDQLRSTPHGSFEKLLERELQELREKLGLGRNG
jgi:hypothetical protein